MGCLNSKGNFKHWFGNIHLSGPCNRKCYFCIGQHMMELDSRNTLNAWPLPGIDQFVDECLDRGVDEINMTGTNTDPLLYSQYQLLHEYLNSRMPAGWAFGIRTNGIALDMHRDHFLHDEGHGDPFFDKVSLTVCSLDDQVNRKMMGGRAPYVPTWLKYTDDLKVNLVLGPENTKNGDVFSTIARLASLGVPRINLREPYGQPHVGNPIALQPSGTIHGMPFWDFGRTIVCYWDVHYVEVESINLYASGRISTDYPITRGHSVFGEVKPQNEFTHGRHREQWLQHNYK